MKDNEFWLKLIPGTLIPIGWIYFFWWKSKNIDSDIGIFVVILSVLTLVGLSLIFGKKLLKLFPKKTEDVPEPMNEEEIREIIEKQANKLWNNIKVENPYEWEKSATINKNLIYAFKVNCNLDNEQFIIIINANYRNKIPTTFPTIRNGQPVDKDDYYIDKEMNRMAQNPFEEPDRTIKRTSLDQFNRPTEEIEEIKHKEKKKEEEPVA